LKRVACDIDRLAEYGRKTIEHFSKGSKHCTMQLVSQYFDIIDICLIWQDIKGFDKSEIREVLSIYQKFEG